MTSSGTYAYQPKVLRLVLEAWVRCGKAPDQLKRQQAEELRYSLIGTMTDMESRGLQLWRVEAIRLATSAGVSLLQVGQASYTLSEGTLDLISVTLERDGAEYELADIGRDDYIAMPRKGTRGRPQMYYLKQEPAPPTLFLYPVPDRSTDFLRAQRIRQSQDISTDPSQTVDAPRRWLEAIQADLTARCAEKYAPERFKEKRDVATEKYLFARDNDTERSPIRLDIRNPYGRL